MPEAYDFAKLLEEIVEDEKLGASKNRKVTQEEIRKLLRERRRFPAKPRDKSKLPLGEALVQEGLLTEEQLNEALKIQSQKRGKIGSILVELDYITNEVLLKFLGKQHGIEGTNLLNIEISESLLSLIPSKVMLKHRVLPLKVEGRTLSLAMETPNDFAAIHEVEFLAGKRVSPVIIPSYQMDLALKVIEERGTKVFTGADIQMLMKGPVTIHSLLEYLLETNGSDLLLTAGVPPTVRVNGTLRRSTMPTLTQDQCVAYAKTLMTERQWEDFLRKKELDFGTDYEGVGRFRVNAYRQRNTVSLAIRRVYEKTLSLDKLGLPEWMEEIALRPQGLILVVGPTGQGKTTTVAALVDIINRNRRCNILTLEDPIEYTHKSVKSNVNQREVGTDTDSFSEGLRRVFRQSPDVLVIGELRDEETFEIALAASSSGHLVITTMHAANTTTAIENIIYRFPNHLHSQVRTQLADCLLLSFYQRLIPKRNEDSLVLAYEKLINSYRVRSFIRENKVHQVRTQIQADAEDFTSVDVSLTRLVRDGKIDKKMALLYCDNQEQMLKISG